jgi:hypothetical protein
MLAHLSEPYRTMSLIAYLQGLGCLSCSAYSGET